MPQSNLALCQIKRHGVAFISINYSVHPMTGGAEGQCKRTYLSSILLNMNKSASVYEWCRTLGQTCGDVLLPQAEY